jgi:diguanylate cyclase (GGDEF)-like protein/putative nucleotidyltransferase with HDIG domain
MPLRTKLQIALTLCAAGAAMTFAARSGPATWAPFWLLLIAVLASSGLKVALPRGDGSMSLNFPFILLGIVQLTPFQAMLLAAISVAAQCRIRALRFSPVQILFNVANAVLSTACACFTFAALHRAKVAIAPALALSSVAYFLWNTTQVAMIIASTKGEKTLPLWRKEFPWYLPFYVVGAVLAAMASWMSARFGWGTALLLIPFVYTLYRSYMGQVNRLKERQQHLEETEALHLRTIEGLAMAIEAKDQGTHDHLFRVRHYVKAVGEALKLDKLEMQALETAAFLHDIGKLAVPEHIINKPGKLTPEEFEKMKIHPVVGADILERVRFPYPVVPIVRSHHEWWNGTGYPDGLQGKDIPVGARILTVIDCFDALVSDRPYRKGMTSDQALNIIRNLKGKQFDPDIVEIFERCHAESESRQEHFVPAGFTPLNTEIEVWRGVAPGAGYEAGSEQNAPLKLQIAAEATQKTDSDAGFVSLSLIAAASQEAQTLFEMSQSLGNSLSPGETVSVMASRLRQLIPFNVCAVYLKQGEALETRFMDGDQAIQFGSQPIQLGEGISGWVAQGGRPIFNGNAAAEPGCPSDANGEPAFRSALSVPLFDLQRQIFGVLTLYAVGPEAFLRDHLRILQAMESKLSLSLQNALQFRRTETDAETDFLTGLPNARRLFLQLEAELDKCQDANSSLAVVVCDLNDFKTVNDRRGHLAGDRLLRMVADSFRQICSGTEMVARMGGDEFVFLLPGVPTEAATERLENITATVSAISRRAGLSVRISASVGAAFYPSDGTIAEDLLAAADRRMYLDKQQYYSQTTALSIEKEAGSPVPCNG